MKHLFADGAYDRRQMLDKAEFLDLILEIVRRSDAPGFQLLPRRWVVERTFGWMARYRRLVRDDKARLDVSEAMIYDKEYPHNELGARERLLRAARYFVARSQGKMVPRDCRR